MDSYLFRLKQSNDGFIAYCREYEKRFNGVNKQDIAKQLRGEFGNGHCRIRRRKMVYTRENLRRKEHT